MMMRKLTAGLLLASSLALTVPLTVLADPVVIQLETDGNEQSETDAAEKESETEADKEAPKTAASIKKSGSKYYLYNNATGKKVTKLKGVQEFPSGSGDYYYFINTKGRIAASRLIRTKSGNIYYADENGKLATGFTTIGENTYYFKKSTHAALKGWKKLAGQRYYFTQNGVRLTGLQKIGKYTYYLNPSNNGARSSGWYKINKKWQYFSSKTGRRQRGKIITEPATGTSYYLDSNGYRKTGLITYKGSLYYFDKKSGISASGKKVGGAMATGWRTIKKKTYYFSQTGKAVTGFLNLNGKKYYFNSSGVMQKGNVTIGTTVYTFDQTTGELTKQEALGPYSIKVNQGTCVVTIYRGNVPVKAMLCSVGLNGATPNGSFTLDRKLQWHELFGNCYGQYTSRITGNILFHSVYYYRYRDENSLATAEFNKLGSPASHGCVRLSCADAYYIYTNCPNGTPVTIFTGTAANDPLPRPAKRWISTSYDPTDPVKGD